MALVGFLAAPVCALGLSIKSVDFMNVDNKSRLQIGLDGKASFDVNREEDNLVLRIDNAKIPGSLARPFITEQFESAVRQILPRQYGDDVVFDISMKQIVPYFVSQDNSELIMDFDIPEWARISSRALPLHYPGSRVFLQRAGRYNCRHMTFSCHLCHEIHASIPLHRSYSGR